MNQKIRDFIDAAWLGVLLVFAPRKLDEKEDEDNAVKNAEEKKRLEKREKERKAGIDTSANFSEDRSRRSSTIRQALVYSFLFVLAAVILGGIIGLFLAHIFGCAPQIAIITLQGVGAAILLWGVLFVRGWDIQSWGGDTLSEKANKFIYRTLHFLGTTAIVCSLVWQQVAT